MKKITLIDDDGNEIEAYTHEKEWKGMWAGTKGKTRPDEGDNWFFLAYDGFITKQAWANIPTHTSVWNLGNGFFTKKAAKRELDRRRAKQRIADYIIENGLEFEPDWKDQHQLKCFISYDWEDRELFISTCKWLQALDGFSFKSYDDVHQVAVNCKDDLLILFGIKEDE